MEQQGATKPITPQLIGQALGNVAPKMSPLVGAAALRLFMPGKNADGEDLTPQFIQDPKTGMRYLGRGKTTLPSGVDPAMATANMADVPGYTGAPTGRGGITYLKTGSTLSQDQLMKSYDADLKALDGLGALTDMTAEQRAAMRADIMARKDALRPGGKAAATGAVPSDADIAYLKANPDVKDKFEKRFGKGAAAKYLK
jgi:hypothetical protein